MLTVDAVRSARAAVSTRDALTKVGANFISHLTRFATAALHAGHFAATGSSTWQQCSWLRTERFCAQGMSREHSGNFVPCISPHVNGTRRSVSQVSTYML